MTFTKCADESEATAVAKLLAVTHMQFNVSSCWPNWKFHWIVQDNPTHSSWYPWQSKWYQYCPI